MSLTSIVFVIKSSVNAFLSWFPRIVSLFKNPNIPGKTLVIVDNDPGYQNFWHIGSQGGKPILQVNCHFMVTNITDRPVALAKAALEGIKGVQDYTLLSVKK